MLAVVYKGIAIPIYWTLLDKRGNSNTAERIALMQCYLNKFDNENVHGLLADREFIGEKWLAWLKSKGIDFYIRIKKDAKVPNSRGVLMQAHCLFRFLKIGESLTIRQPRTMTGVEVYLSALRLDDGELLIIASSKLCENALEIYGKRWEIETLFSCLKGRGFNLEDTRVTDTTRIKRLLVIPVIAFCWAHRVGEWQHEEVKAIKLKKHQRLAKSIFKCGLDLIRDKLLTSPLASFYESFLQFIDIKNNYSLE